MSIPYGDLSTVRGCIEIYGGPIEQKIIQKKGYPNLEIHPFDFRTSLENAAFKCDDVAVEVLLREMTSGKALESKRNDSLLIVEAVLKDLLEDCAYNSDSGKYGEVLWQLKDSLKVLKKV